MEHTNLKPRSSRKYRSFCAVKNCSSRSDKYPNLSFHSFPKAKERIVLLKNYLGEMEKIDRFEAWKKVTKVKDVSKCTAVCSLHFKRDDFILPDFPAQRKHLKKFAVPSCNLPTITTEKVLLKRQQRNGNKPNHDDSNEFGENVDDVSFQHKMVHCVVQEGVDTMQEDEVEVKQETEFVNVDNYDATQFDTIFENIPEPPLNPGNDNEEVFESTPESITSTTKQNTSLEGLSNQLEEVHKIVKNISYEQTKRDECSLYADFLASKLRKLDQNSRKVLMNEIDNVFFRMTQLKSSLRVRCSNSENSSQLKLSPANEKQSSSSHWSIEVSKSADCDLIKEEIEHFS